MPGPPLILCQLQHRVPKAHAHYKRKTTLKTAHSPPIGLGGSMPVGGVWKGGGIPGRPGGVATKAGLGGGGSADVCGGGSKGGAPSVGGTPTGGICPLIALLSLSWSDGSLKVYGEY